MEESLKRLQQKEEDEELQKKISKEEGKKKQKEIDYMKKEIAKHIAAIEEEREEVTRVQRKLIQIEENHKQMKQEYDEVLRINKELEIQVGETYVKKARHHDNEKSIVVEEYE